MERDSKGRIKKGSGGRPEGATNKTTKATREAFQMLVDRNFDKLESWIDVTAQSNPKDAFYMVMDLASFCVPRLKAIEVSTPDDKAFVVRFVDAGSNP